MRSSSESGQSTVEAAFLLPIILIVFGLLLQPAILLYDRCMMSNAAAEGCRLLATCTGNESSVRAYIERRLAAIPRIPLFHESDTWEIEWDIGGSGADARVVIVNRMKPLPLFGVIAGLAGLSDSDGCISQRVEESSTCIPAWTGASGGDPASWIGAWK